MRYAVVARAMTLVALGLLASLDMGPAYAEETTCVGMLVGVTVDNLRVPSGRTCTLDATRVKGTLKVERDAVCPWSACRRQPAGGKCQAGQRDGRFDGRRRHPAQAGRCGDDTPCPGHGRHPVRVQLGGAGRTRQSSPWQPARFPEQGAHQGCRQRDRRQSAMQGKCSRTNGRRQHCPREQGRPVQATLANQRDKARMHPVAGTLPPDNHPTFGRRSSAALIASSG